MGLRAAACIGPLLLGILAAPVSSGAQGKIVRVGVLGPAAPRFAELAGGLRLGLHDQGHSEEAVRILEGRVQRGDRAGARAAVEALLREGAQVVFVIGSELARVAREAAPELPVVFITPGDPVAAGLVASLANPGSHITGMTFEYPELSGKRLELLRELAPRIRRVLVLYDPRDASPRQGVAAARDAASKLGMALVERETRSRDELRRELEASLGAVDALLGVPGGLVSDHFEEVIRAANARRVPTMFHARTKATAEALATYGTSDVDIARQAARLVDRILKGTKAADLPVERPMKLELVLNLKTAKALGLALPGSVLFRADRVIQ
jgi:putative ABC transport system substrate-binding protein